MRRLRRVISSRAASMALASRWFSIAGSPPVDSRHTQHDILADQVGLSQAGSRRQ